LHIIPTGVCGNWSNGLEGATDISHDPGTVGAWLLPALPAPDGITSSVRRYHCNSEDATVATVGHTSSECQYWSGLREPERC